MANPWQSKVRGLLQEGWGSQDIAVMLNVDVEAVSMMIRIMRQNGILEQIYRRPTNG